MNDLLKVHCTAKQQQSWDWSPGARIPGAAARELFPLPAGMSILVVTCDREHLRATWTRVRHTEP